MIPLGLASLCACSSAREDAPAIKGKSVVALTTVVFSGNRYVVTADFGQNRAVPLMVHGNAAMYLALTHHVGAMLNGGPLRKVEDYGYSSRGKAYVSVPLMRLGGIESSRLQNVPVFDFTEDGEGPVQGMVGVPFLASHRAVIDFSRDLMILGAATSQTPNQRLLERGYRYARIALDQHSRVTMEAYFPALDSILTITPSTVSSALTLHHPLFAGRVPMTQTASPDRSPRRTTPDEFRCDRIEFEVAGVRLASPAVLEDFAKYAAIPEAELRSVGLLGYDWMKQHDAIIDYANRCLYFKP